MWSVYINAPWLWSLIGGGEDVFVCFSVYVWTGCVCPYVSVSINAGRSRDDSVIACLGQQNKKQAFVERTLWSGLLLPLTLPER